MPKFIDLTKQRFGKLVVTKKSGHRGPNILWECLCDCGNTHTTLGWCLKQGHTKSCGCNSSRKNFGK